MLRRLHTRIIGLGAVCGLSPSPPAELFLKSLPPPAEADPGKHARFTEEEEVAAGRGRPSPTAPLSYQPAPEPFFDIISGAAGHQHVVLLTREGNAITFGDNRYGQTAAPRRRDSAWRIALPAGLPASRGTAPAAAGAPLYIDLDGALAPTPRSDARVACGGNFTILYTRGGRRAIAFGNNHMGQLGVGHKKPVDSEKGFAEWNPLASWWPSAGTGDGSGSTIERIACGYNHSIVQLTCGALFAFGSNTWGELGLGSTTSPQAPERVSFFEQRHVCIKKVVAGNSFTLFLTVDGRVYGCGATNYGQLPINAHEPVPVAITRGLVQGEPMTSRGTGAPKLIRIKDVACVGSLAVFVSVKDEIFLQGSLPEYGVQIPSPRLLQVKQGSAIASFSRTMGDASNEQGAGFVIEELVQGPSTVLVRYRNGCVAGLGANTAGQLHSVIKERNGKKMNTAPACIWEEVFPVFTPSRLSWARGPEVWGTSWLVAGDGFTLLFDNEEAYAVAEEAEPIELPQSHTHDQEARNTPRTQRLRRALL